MWRESGANTVTMYSMFLHVGMCVCLCYKQNWTNEAEETNEVVNHCDK